MLMNTRILKWQDLAPIVGCSRVTIWRMEKAGDFPKRIRISPQMVGWLEHEVEAWLAQRMAVRVEDERETTSDDYDDSMDGDNASALASAGLGTDEDYGGGCDRF
jgi:prophage regulatory protein